MSQLCTSFPEAIEGTMSIHDQAEREIELLERELENTDDPDERRLIADEIRRVAQEVSIYERWREEGDENGW